MEGGKIVDGLDTIEAGPARLSQVVGSVFQDIDGQMVASIVEDELLKKLNEEFGMTVVIVEQKIMLLCQYAKRLIVMDKGKLLFDGKVRDVLQNARALIGVGVNVPRVTALAHELAQRGLYSGPLPVSVPEAERMVREVLA